MNDPFDTPWTWFVLLVTNIVFVLYPWADWSRPVSFVAAIGSAGMFVLTAHDRWGY